jgi:hypothetical protein
VPLANRGGAFPLRFFQDIGEYTSFSVCNAHPLSTLGLDERRLYADLATNPQDPELPHLLADAAEDQGLQSRVTLLHQQPRTALLELLRGRALDEADCQAILRETAEPARRISHLLGRPDSEAPLPDVLTDGGLTEQLAFAQTLLATAAEEVRATRSAAV